MTLTKGLHIVSEFYDYSETYGFDLETVKKEISSKIQEIGLTELGNYYHSFGEDAYTGIICLAESHISIHTWPESQFLTLDIYVCNYNEDNSNKARYLFDFFRIFYNPGRHNVQYIER